MTSLRSKIDVCDNILKEIIGNNDDKTKSIRMECETCIKKLLSRVDQMKKDLKMDRWVHLAPTSPQYQLYKMVRVHFEAYGYVCFGKLILSFNIEESRSIAITYYEKARTIYNLLGHDEGSIIAKNTIANLKLEQPVLETYRHNYKVNMASWGATSVNAIRAGLDYAAALIKVLRFIEAERLIIKLATGSRQVHGPEHICTMNANEALRKCEKRYVTVLPNEEPFEALRYENDGEICVVTGPIAEPRHVDDEQIFHVSSELIVPVRCPVICHGLVSASHLNGKMGDIRARCMNTAGGLRFAVHFEDKSLKPATVKPENLRIVFNLQSEE
jgi:hypothetical protein